MLKPDSVHSPCQEKCTLGTGAHLGFNTGLNACITQYSNPINFSDTSAQRHKYLHQEKSINWTCICITLNNMVVLRWLFSWNNKQMASNHVAMKVEYTSYPSEPSINPAGMWTSLAVPSWIMSTKGSPLTYCSLSVINTAMAPWLSTVLVFETKEQPLKQNMRVRVFSTCKRAKLLRLICPDQLINKAQCTTECRKEVSMLNNIYSPNTSTFKHLLYCIYWITLLWLYNSHSLFCFQFFMKHQTM